MNTVKDPLPLVSIIIPYHSQSAYIAETIASVRRQTYPNIELIVVDDESSKEHEKALRHIGDIVIHRISNSGPPAARNYGYRQSTGAYVVFLDADDVLSDRAIELNLMTLLKHPESPLVFGAVKVINSDGSTLRNERICLPRRSHFLMLLETNPICSPGAAMIRRHAFDQAGGFMELRTFQTDDYELYLQLAKHGRFCQHNECVLQYRRHDTNMSNDRIQMLSATLASLDRVASAHSLSLFQRLLLRHGRRRWKYEYSRPEGRFFAIRSIYFTIATSWNIKLLEFVQLYLQK